MADSQRPGPGPQRQFKLRAGVKRKTAEERAASIQAEALKQINQTQPERSQAQPNTGRRTGPIQREPRIRSQNTGSVFSASGAVTSSRAKGSHAVSGTEELIQRAEGNDVDAVGLGKTGKVEAKLGSEEKPAATTKRANGRLAKSATNKDDIESISGDELEGTEGKPVDIEDIDRISISSGREDEGDDDVVASGRRTGNKNSKAVRGLRPVRAARDIPARGEDQESVYIKARREVEGKEGGKVDPDRGDKMDVDDEDENIAVTVSRTTHRSEDKSIFPPRGTTKKRRKSSTKDGKPHLETSEERAERDRYTCELRKLRQELSTGSRDHRQKDPESQEAAVRDPHDGRLYLFQFPPLTPMLINSLHQDAIKVEATADMNAAAATPATLNGLAEQQIKREEEGGMEAKGQTSTEPESGKLLTAANISAMPAGLAGKLNVHQSGKVTMEWGGGGGTKPTSLEVKWGSEVDFLQDVVLTSDAQENEAAEGRKAWALRQVSNKFVAVPDWGKVYD